MPLLFLNLRKHSSGNALFLILIAVALFAALSYAVTQSGRGGGSAGRETASLSASNMLAYGNELRQAIQRMMLINGCTETSISFYSTRFATPGDYGSAPAASDSCHVFYPGGGNITWQAPPGQPEYLISGTFRFTGVGTDGLPNNDSVDLSMIGKTTRDICLAVNTLAGVANTGGNPPSRAGETFDIPYGWGGAFDGWYGNWNNSDSLTDLWGYTAGCWYDSDDGDYNFFYILHER